MKKWTAGILILTFLLTGCQIFVPKPQDDLLELTLNLTYIPNVQFAPFYVAIEKGYFEEVGLKVNLSYGNEADMIALIGSDYHKFMIASGEQVLLSRAQGLPVVSVANWYKDYPVGVASLKSSNISSVTDLKGKTIGLPGLYGANYIGFEAMALQAGLKETDYKLRSIGFTQVEALATNQVDAVVIYLANEPVQLQARGFEVNVLRAADQLALVGNCLVTNEKTISEQSDLVKSMVNAVRRGIETAALNPDEAYEISKKYVENLASSDAEIQKQVLMESIKLWQIDAPLLSEELPKWENMQTVLLQMGLMSQPIDIKGAFTDAFIR